MEGNLKVRCGGKEGLNIFEVPPLGKGTPFALSAWWAGTCAACAVSTRALRAPARGERSAANRPSARLRRDAVSDCKESVNEQIALAARKAGGRYLGMGKGKSGDDLRVNLAPFAGSCPAAHCSESAALPLNSPSTLDPDPP